MREPIFRAFNKKTGQMESVLLIDFVNKYVDVLSVANLEGGNQESWGFENIELMGPVGLKDKQGIEIYEGDIVRAERTPDLPIVGGYMGINPAKKHYEHRVVEFKITEDGVHFILEKDISYSERRPENQLQWEIIGNIYQTPELKNQP